MRETNMSCLINRKHSKNIYKCVLLRLFYVYLSKTQQTHWQSFANLYFVQKIQFLSLTL